jgi:hypothetical protein
MRLQSTSAPFCRFGRAARPQLARAPPPTNCTKPYAADATWRSTGETSMTACVVSVLLIPISTPAAMTTTPRVGFESIQIPKAAGIAAYKG